jgi:hypothetical protein
VIERKNCSDVLAKSDAEELQDDLMQHKARHRNGSDSGMSLVAVLVGVAILGIVAMVLSEVFKTQFRANKELDLKVARMAVLRHLNYKLHEYCPPQPAHLAWVPTGSCTVEQYVALPTSNPAAPVIKMYDPANPAASQPLGELLLRAKCKQVDASSPKTLVVEAIEARGLAAGKWFDISPKIPLACQINR